MRDTIIEITGAFQLSGSNAKLRPLKAVFGSEYKVKNKVGSLSVSQYTKTLGILLDMLILNYDQLEKNKIDTIAIHLHILYQNQCNWEATAEEVRKMNFLKATLNISISRTY